MKRLLVLLVSIAAAGPGQEVAPSLLSRGMIADLRPGRFETVFQPYIGTLGGYDSGPLTRDLGRGDGPFEEFDGGLAARRSSRSVSADLDYRFGARHYFYNRRLDRSNHELHLDTRVRLSHRWSLLLRDSATSYSFGRDLAEAPGGLVTGLPVEGGPDVLHTRTLANTGLADLVFAPTARTSLAVGGDGFFVDWQFRGLADVAGWRARADLAHRLTRHQTVSLAYSFTRFDYQQSFGGADYAVLAAGYAVRLGRGSELDLLGGAGRLRSAAVRPVELDPEIARLLGVARGAEIFRLDTWTPHLLAAFTQAWGRVQLRAEYVRMATDGGGLSGLERRNRAAVMVSGPLSRRVRMSLQVAGYTHRSLDTRLYDGRAVSSGFTLSRRLGSQAEIVTRYAYSFHDFERGLLQHFNRHQASVGLLFYFKPLERAEPAPGLALASR
jgi:hypothetical protein